MAGATRTKGLYLGKWETVADAEKTGVMLAWEEHDRVAIDSQGVIQGIWNLQFDPPRSCINEALVAQMQRRPRTLMWVKGHQGERGNEEADMRVREEVEIAWRLQKRVIATPAGIKHEHPIYPTAPARIRWSPRVLKGLVYMVTDKGSQQQWLYEIGKSDEPWCVCDSWTPQNAAHLQQCLWVGDWRGRTGEQMWDDEKWCEKVADFILQFCR